MSWIEVPRDEIVGSFNLSKLTIDQAYLNFSIPANNVTYWLYQLSSECFKCPFSRVGEVKLDEATIIDTLYAVKYRLRTDSSSSIAPINNDNYKVCDFGGDETRFGEFGVYNVHISSNSSSCYVQTVAEPVNIYLPLLLALFFYIFLILLKFSYVKITKFLEKRKFPIDKGNSNETIDSTTAKNEDLQENQINANSAASKNAASLNRPQKQRLKSLDTLRGICIVVMIFVNDGGARYYFFEHATWDGLTIADLVFPWFLWIMGVCVPIGIKSQVKRGTPRFKIFKNILWRSIKLIGLGIMHNSLYGPVKFGTDANLRIPGVLQRFGVSYFICATLVLVSMSVNFSKPESSKLKAAIQDIGIIWISWIPVIVLVVVHFMLTFFLEVPDCPTGYLGPAGNHDNELGNVSNRINASCIGGAAGYIDLQIFSLKHIYKYPTARGIYESGPYDPEGFLGILTTVFQVWLGVQGGVTMLVYPRPWSRLKRWGIWAIVTGTIGAVLCGGKITGGWIPVNKNLWSFSFVLVTSCFAFTLLMALYLIIDMKKWWNGSPFFEPGMNSILLYVGHSTFANSLPWNWSDGLMRTHFIKLVESLWGTSLWALIAIWLHQKKLYWTV